MTPNQLPPLPEPDGQMTVTFGLDEKRKVPVFFGDRLTAYALAALAQQAQEPVAWLYVDTVGERYLCFSRPTGGGTITNLYATPPAPQAPGRRKGPPGITLEPQGHEPPAVPVVSDEQIRKTVESIQDPDTVPAFHNGYYTLTPDELRRAILAMRPAVEPMTPLTDSEMEKGREQIFSTNNPYCPCDRKTFRKVAQWVEWHHKIGITAKAEGGA